MRKQEGGFGWSPSTLFFCFSAVVGPSGRNLFGFVLFLKNKIRKIKHGTSPHTRD